MNDNYGYRDIRNDRVTIRTVGVNGNMSRIGGVRMAIDFSKYDNLLKKL